MAQQIICDICKKNLADMSFKVKQSIKQWDFSGIPRNRYVTIDVCNECGNKLLGVSNLNSIIPKHQPSASDVIQKVKASTTYGVTTKPYDIEKMTGKKQ